MSLFYEIKEYKLLFSLYIHCNIKLLHITLNSLKVSETLNSISLFFIRFIKFYEIC